MVPRSRGKKEAQAMWEPGGKKHEKTIKLSSQKKNARDTLIVEVSWKSA